jgi:hypothetical protein
MQVNRSENCSNTHVVLYGTLSNLTSQQSGPLGNSTSLHLIADAGRFDTVLLDSEALDLDNYALYLVHNIFAYGIGIDKFEGNLFPPQIE